MLIRLVDPGYLMPDLVRRLREADCAVTQVGERTVEVFTPRLASRIESSAYVAATVNGWAALHDAQVEIDPPPLRFAHPLTLRGGSHPSDFERTGPTVSIGVPVFNGGRYLEEALSSLVSQTFDDVEIVICDNASTDTSLEIARSFERADERVTVHTSETNRGAAWNYNRVLGLARGRYFKWAAHDDICHPMYVERCVEVLDRAPESVVVAYPQTVLIDEAGLPVSVYADGLDLRQPRPHQRLAVLIRNLVLSNAVFGLSRTDALRRTQGHGTYVSADYILLAELAMAGQFWEIPEPLFFRRAHNATSRAANQSTAAVAEWFAPGTGDDRTTEFLRLFREYLRAIERADIGSGDKLAVYTTTVPLWLRRFHGSIRSELVRQATASLRLSTHATAPPRTVADRPMIRPRAVAKPTAIAVRDALRRLIWQVAPSYAPQIQLHVDPSLTIEWSEPGFETIVTNLISNAVRYGSAPIVISATADDRFELVVEDGGRGVSAEFVPRLFEPFSRSGASSTEMAGAGLGLAIARMAAEHDDGTLVYEDATPGARFRLVLPGHTLGETPRSAPPGRSVPRPVRAAAQRYCVAFPTARFC